MKRAEETIVLRNLFKEISSRYTSDQRLIARLWEEIEIAYSSSGRHYHNLHHLFSMESVLRDVTIHVNFPDDLIFALFYHDIVYDPSRNDNETSSAAFSKERLHELNVDDLSISRVSKIIEATRSHLPGADSDTHYFLDADLLILGSSGKVYDTYAKNIRREYSFVPENVFKTGRRAVLECFLEMKSIYKTDYFRTKFESIAQANIERELVSC